MAPPDYDELQRIWDLKEKGAISEEEYSRLKARILDPSDNTGRLEKDGPRANDLPSPGLVQVRDESSDLGNAKAVGIGCAVIGAIVLIIAAVGSGGTGTSNSASNVMNVDENLVATDMNATDMNATDMNVAAPAIDYNATTGTSVDSSDETSTKADIASAAIPSFDTEAYCRKIGDTAGGSYEIEETCRSEEADALAKLNSMSIPDRILRYCSDIGETAEGSYQIMETCVEQESESASRL